MAVKTPVGYTQCPECDNPDADVKQDKNGHHYRYCGLCNAQYFTRGDEVRERNLLAKMRPIAPATDTPRESSAGGESAEDGEGEGARKPPRSDKATSAAPGRSSSGLLIG